MHPPTQQPQPVPQPSVFHEPPDPRPPFMHRSSSFDPFFQPAPQPVPDVFQAFFAYPPHPFMYTSPPTPGPAPVPTPQFYPEYHHPFAFPFQMFSMPPVPQPEPHPIPVMPGPPPPPPGFFYMSPPTVAPHVYYQPPVPTPPSVETSPEEEYFPANQSQEPRRWRPMQPLPPEPKLPKIPRKGRTGFINKLRRRESSPAFTPRRGWDEQDAAYRRGDTSLNGAQRMKEFFSYFTRRH
jgi:hypothetical protein